MPVSDKTYERVALEDPEGLWELHCGRLRRKPEMTAEHDHLARDLAKQLIRQLTPDEFDVGINSGRLRRPGGGYHLPDVVVIPLAYVRRKLNRSGRLEVYDEPMPLVVEIWSPSTGDYDVEEKLGEYQRRGDAEIWRIHPYERTLTAWRKQPDGSYAETLHRSGTIQPVALPGVAIDLDALFTY